MDNTIGEEAANSANTNVKEQNQCVFLLGVDAEIVANACITKHNATLSNKVQVPGVDADNVEIADFMEQNATLEGKIKAPGVDAEKAGSAEEALRNHG